MAHKRTFKFDIQKALRRRRSRRNTGSPKFDSRFDFKSEIPESVTPDIREIKRPEVNEQMRRILRQVAIREDLKPNTIQNKQARRQTLIQLLTRKFNLR